MKHKHPLSRTFILFVFVSFVVIISTIVYGGEIFTTYLPSISSQTASVEEASPGPLELSDKELFDLVKPSVVRIIVRTEGEMSLAPFDITIPTSDIKNPKITEIKETKPIIIPIKKDVFVFSGSGFVVNPDGYILTNAHVAGNDLMIERALVARVVAKIYLGAMLDISKHVSDAKFEKLKKEQGITRENLIKEHEKFLTAAIDFVVKRGTFSIKTNLTVLRPDSKGEKIADFESQGFPAKLIYTNQDFEKDDRDIAILKINEAELPSLTLSTLENPTSGQQVYVFGFPGNADFTTSNFLEPSFTKGSISAIKDSVHGSLKVFQTDAKISAGSSGGPSFDAYGKVSGITTLLTGSATEGDMFAVLLPTTIAKIPLSDNFIINEEGAYGVHFRNGLQFLAKKHCKQALQEFTLAGETNQNFGVDKILDPYIAQCNTLIKNGGSIDTRWDEFAQKIKDTALSTWLMMAAGIFVTILLVVLTIIFSRRLKKEKEEIDHLEHVIGDIENGAAHRGESSVLVSESSTSYPIGSNTFSGQNPDIMMTSSDSPLTPAIQLTPLIQYIKKARAAGITSDTIATELKKAGWDDEDIARGIQEE